MARRSAEEKLLDAAVGLGGALTLLHARRLLREVKREWAKAASDRAVKALEDTGDWKAVVAAIMGGPRRG